MAQKSNTREMFPWRRGLNFFKLSAKSPGSKREPRSTRGFEARLNQRFGAQSEQFPFLSALCVMGEAEGWLVNREAGGIKFGPAVKPGKEAARFSVDVVRMQDIAGPHHVHTMGEIGAIIPIGGVPKFDGKPKGWYVYPPGSSHRPTVAGGDAYILHVLPDGAIEFTNKQ